MSVTFTQPCFISLGIDYQSFTHRFQGLDARLTGVEEELRPLNRSLPDTQALGRRDFRSSGTPFFTKKQG